MRELKAAQSSLRSVSDKIISDQASQFRHYDQKIANNNLDIKRSHKCYLDLAERVNVYEIKSNHLFLTVDGLPENKELSTAQALITRLKSDTNIVLSESDFTSIYRVGKPRKAKAKPRQIKIKFASDTARNQLLTARGKLKSNPDSSQIWINEEHPETYINAEKSCLEI